MTCGYCENDNVALLEVTDRGFIYCAVCSRVTVRGAAARLPRRVAAAGGEARVGRPAAGSHTGSEDSPPMRKICGVFVGLCLLLLPALVQAQTGLVYNPTTVEFTKSPDHDVTLAGGEAMVSSYEFRIYAPGATAPTTKTTLGKPTPDATGKVIVGVTSQIIALPLSASVQYKARIAALGPTGETESADSNPFLRVGPPGAVPSVVLRR